MDLFHNTDHLIMDGAIRGQGLVFPDRERMTGEVREFPARFFDNQAGGGGVPRTKLEFPEAV